MMMMMMMMMYTDDEISGRLPSDLTNLDSTELRTLDNEVPINVDWGSFSGVPMTSLSSVTMTSLSPDDKVASAVRLKFR